MSIRTATRSKSDAKKEALGPVNMGKVIPIIARKHFDSPNNFVLFVWNGFPAKWESIEEVAFI